MRTEVVQGFYEVDQATAPKSHFQESGKTPLISDLTLKRARILQISSVRKRFKYHNIKNRLRWYF
ncbi:hypothetical protein CPter91_5222 [Collimonas pratensis]|uniref:Uncharacterized protein n=1 Tax=Collimonas pratensis TaxID=279113 RepID=A0A127QBV0_9BURK|nr:hypothetical protein CPter91_5222 [Collimonas pratensis]